MKAFVKVIVKSLDYYTSRRERIEYLETENDKYAKVLSILNELETSDTNKELIATVKNEIKCNTNHIEAYEKELKDIEQLVEDIYDKETAYNELFISDVDTMVEIMRENVASDVKAGYSIEKVKQELEEIEDYKTVQNKIYDNFSNEPNMNERFFAYMVNKGAISLD